MFHRTAGADPGRDGCRVPLPWSGEHPPFGFSPDDATAEPWLPQQPESWSRMSVEAEKGDPDSMLELYREALRLRREEPGLRTDREPLRWLPADPEVLAYRRGEDFACVVNFGPQDAVLPEHQEILLASGPLTEDGRLPADTAAWLRLG